jgi:DNA-binding transcriptional ArsR family regulator
LDNLLTGIIASKTRIKLLMRLFLNPESKSYLRELAKDFDVSTNAVREELSMLTKTRLVICEKQGRKIYYMANERHSLFPELRSMVRKAIGIDRVIDGIIQRLGDVKFAYLIDDYAEGKDSGIIDLVLVGNIDQYHLNDLSRKTERHLKRKIRHLVLSEDEFIELKRPLTQRPNILIWQYKCLEQAIMPSEA